MVAPSVNPVGSAVPAVATASSETTVIQRVQSDCTVSRVTYTPKADITGANTNNRAVALVNKGQDGNGNVQVATYTFSSGNNASDFDEKDLTLSGTPANLQLAAGDILAWASTPNGTGLADPGGYVGVQTSFRGGHSAAGKIQAQY